MATLPVIQPQASVPQRARPLRITILTSSYPAYRGDYAGIFIEKMAMPLALKGHKVTVVAPGCPGSPRHEDHANLQVYRFRYFLPFLERLAYGPGGIPENLKRNPLLLFLVPFFLLGFLRAAWKHTEGADVIHANWILPAGRIAAAVGAWRKVPYVLTVRGSDLNIAAKNMLLSGVGQKALFGAALVTTVGEALREQVIALGIAAEKVRVIPSGVEVHTQRPAGQERPALERPRGVFVGSLRELKGVDVLLDALALLHKKGRRGTLWIVGEGPERGRLEERARALGISDRIYFAGQRPHGEIGSWIAECDYLVLPSFSEGRPNVVYEAFACGVPVVATDIPGTREIVKDKQTGLLVPTRDPGALSEAMDQVGSNEVLAQHLSEGAHQWLGTQGLTWEECARNYLEAFRTAAPYPLHPG